MAENALAQIPSRLGAVGARKPSGLVMKQRFDAVGCMTFHTKYLIPVAAFTARALQSCVGAMAVEVGEGVRGFFGAQIVALMTGQAILLLLMAKIAGLRIQSGPGAMMVLPIEGVIRWFDAFFGVAISTGAGGGQGESIKRFGLGNPGMAGGAVETITRMVHMRKILNRGEIITWGYLFIGMTKCTTRIIFNIVAVGTGLHARPAISGHRFSFAPDGVAVGAGQLRILDMEAVREGQPLNARHFLGYEKKREA